MEQREREVLIEASRCEDARHCTPSPRILATVRAVRFTLAAPTIVCTRGGSATALLLPRGSRFDIAARFQDGDVRVGEIPFHLEVDQRVALVDVHGHEVVWSMLERAR